MSQFAMFTDSSVNPITRFGIGACLTISSSTLNENVDDLKYSDYVEGIRFRVFRNTSSTQLELETSLWALNEFTSREFGSVERGQLTLYTDSQGVAGLVGRRKRLEAKKFLSNHTKKELTHASLYRSFYKLQDKIGFNVVKVKGHQPKMEHDTIHRCFSWVDQAARKKLHELIDSSM